MRKKNLPIEKIIKIDMLFIVKIASKNTKGLGFLRLAEIY